MVIEKQTNKQTNKQTKTKMYTTFCCQRFTIGTIFQFFKVLGLGILILVIDPSPDALFPFFGIPCIVVVVWNISFILVRKGFRNSSPFLLVYRRNIGLLLQCTLKKLKVSINNLRFSYIPGTEVRTEYLSHACVWYGMFTFTLLYYIHTS